MPVPTLNNLQRNLVQARESSAGQVDVLNNNAGPNINSIATQSSAGPGIECRAGRRTK